MRQKFRLFALMLIFMCIFPITVNAALPDQNLKEIDSITVDIDGYVHIKWELSEEIDGVELYRDGSRIAIIGNNGTEAAEYIDRTVFRGKDYTYKIRAYKNLEEIEYSDFSEERTVKVPYIYQDPPKPVLAARQVDKKINLSWKDISGVSKFEVYRSATIDGVYQKIAVTDQNTYLDTRIDLFRTYYYKIKSVKQYETNIVKFSEFSNCVKILTAGNPSQVKSLNIKLGSNKVSLKWKKAVNAHGYIVYREYDKNGNYKKIGTVAENKNTFIDQTVTKPGTYRYTVKAYWKAADKVYYGKNSTAKKIKIKELYCQVSGVKNIMQFPELPNGCEPTSLAIILNWMGYKVSKTSITYEYMPRGPLHSTDPYIAYLGDPGQGVKGYGCWGSVIVKTANNYFNKNKIKARAAVNLKGTAAKDLFKQINAGRPVIIWGTLNMGHTNFFVAGRVNGEAVFWANRAHCVVLTGYDYRSETVTIADPIRGTRKYRMKDFESAYKRMGKEAVVIY